jgi:predicted DNA-binding protein YlxM (UPF0122 family)
VGGLLGEPVKAVVRLTPLAHQLYFFDQLVFNRIAEQIQRRLRSINDELSANNCNENNCNENNRRLLLIDAMSRRQNLSTSEQAEAEADNLLRRLLTGLNNSIISNYNLIKTHHA